MQVEGPSLRRSPCQWGVGSNAADSTVGIWSVSFRSQPMDGPGVVSPDRGPPKMALPVDVG